MSKVGCIYVVAFRYYDIRSDSIKAKKRPFLIIKEEVGGHPRDLTCLPVSKVTRENRRDSVYDIQVNREDYPDLNLNSENSFIRCHKIQTINEKDLISKICSNFENEYPCLYESIKLKVKDYYGDTL